MVSKLPPAQKGPDPSGQGGSLAQHALWQTKAAPTSSLKYPTLASRLLPKLFPPVLGRLSPLSLGVPALLWTTPIRPSPHPKWSSAF